MDPIMKREIILEHYQNPVNRGKTDDSKYITINTNNESCIDNLDIQYKVEDGIITDIRFDGEACCISTSATSVMIKEILGKSLEEAKIILENYENMIEERSYDPEVLGELNVYEETYLQPNRKKCALLPFESLKKLVNQK